MNGTRKFVYPAEVRSDADIIGFPVGSLFLSDGEAFRLCSFNTDWQDDALPLNVPEFSVHGVSGSSWSVSRKQAAPYPMAVVFVPSQSTEDEK